MKDLKLLNRIYPGKKEQVKRIILKYSVSCLYKNGIESTTIEMIKKQAKVSLGTIYYHFKNKEEIIARLVLAAVEDLFCYRQRYLLDAKNFKECVYATVLSYADWVSEHPHFAQIMLSGKFDVHAGEFQCELLDKKLKNRSRLEEWVSMPEYQFDLDKIPYEILSSLINGPIEHYCKYWLLDRVKKSPKEMRVEIAHATWNTIKYYEEF